MQNMADEVEKRCPNAIVVRLGVLRDYVRWNRSDKVVRSWNGAVQQEQPCSLKVGNLLEPVPEARLNLQSVPQEALDELWAAYRRKDPKDPKEVKGFKSGALAARQREVSQQQLVLRNVLEVFLADRPEQLRRATTRAR